MFALARKGTHTKISNGERYISMVFCRRQTLVSAPVFPTNTNISKMQAQSGKDYEGEADFFPQNITDDSKALAFCKLLHFPVAGLCRSQPSWEFSLSVGAPRKHREDKISHIDSRIGEAPDGETLLVSVPYALCSSTACLHLLCCQYSTFPKHYTCTTRL